MTGKENANPTLAFAPHSGWTVVVVMGGPPGNPEVLYRGRIEMADRSLRRSKQPYHEVEGMEISAAKAQLDRFTTSAVTLAHQGMQSLLKEIEKNAGRPRVAGILDSSGRKGASLDAILASHALIHTADGDHFRDALAVACKKSGIPVVRIRQRELAEHASATLRRSPAWLEKMIRTLGLKLGAPWGVDQKSAALFAWLLLADPRGAVRRHQK